MAEDSENKEQSFQMGQVVYILSDKAEKIVPAIVVEEVVVKKLDGNSVSWKVAIGPPNKKKTIDSKNLSGEIYTTLDEIKEVMMNRLTNFVDNLVKDAEKRTEAWYGKQLVQPAKAPNDGGVPGKIDPASLIDFIDGSNGSNVNGSNPGSNMPTNHNNPQPKSEQKNSEILEGSYKVKAPANQGPLQNQQPIDPNDPRSSLRQRLMEMAQPDPSEEDESGNTAEYMVTPDGRKIPVKYNVEE